MFAQIELSAPDIIAAACYAAAGPTRGVARPTAVAVCEMLRQTPLIAITAYVSALATVVHELYNTATRSHPTIHAGMAVGWSAFKGSERARQLLTDLKATMPGDSKKRQGQTASVLRTAVYSTYSAAMLVVYERTLAAQAPTPIAECSLGAGSAAGMSYFLGATANAQFRKYGGPKHRPVRSQSKRPEHPARIVLLDHLVRSSTESIAASPRAGSDALTDALRVSSQAIPTTARFPGRFF